MVSITLDDRDRTMLERLADGDASVEALAETVDGDPSAVASRLGDLADNGLVVEADDGRYELTGNGERVLASSPAGTEDDRIDTPPAIEEQIEAFDLRPDREDAVRNAFSFLRYWGEAPASEIVDGVYSEDPAGYDDAETWWTELVRDRLADLPDVEAPADGDGQWRYAGTATVEEHTDDGRQELSPEDLAEHGSVAEALDRLDLSGAERDAVRAAFEFLAASEEASGDAIKGAVYAGHEAGYDDADEWWRECVRDAFAELPGVEQVDVGRERWRYDQPTGDSASNGAADGE